MKYIILVAVLFSAFSPAHAQVGSDKYALLYKKLVMPVANCDSSESPCLEKTIRYVNRKTEKLEIVIEVNVHAPTDTVLIPSLGKDAFNKQGFYLVRTYFLNPAVDSQLTLRTALIGMAKTDKEHLLALLDRIVQRYYSFRLTTVDKENIYLYLLHALPY
jgi:hypothetical protein